MAQAPMDPWRIAQGLPFVEPIQKGMDMFQENVYDPAAAQIDALMKYVASMMPQQQQPMGQPGPGGIVGGGLRGKMTGQQRPPLEY